MMYDVTVFPEVAQEASGGAADTVTVDGRGQVDPGAAREGVSDAEKSVARVDDKN
jgi:hypothetical protein